MGIKKKKKRQAISLACENIENKKELWYKQYKFWP